MWIRSQDGLSLRKYEGITINYGNKTELLGDASILEEGADPYHILGKYKTEERTLEILNNIQSLIEESVSFGNIVYEMPKE